MLLICGILLFAGSVLAGNFRDSNTYMDQVINFQLKDEIRYMGLEPADIPDFHFKDKSKTLDLKAEGDFKRGKLYGLTNVQRWEDCSAPYFAYGNVTLDCPLTIKDLKVEYEGHVKYGKLPTVTIKGKVDIPETKLRVQVTTATNRNLPQLRSLVVEKFSNIKASFSGLGNPLNKLLNGLRHMFLPNVESNLRHIFQTRFSDALNHSVVRYTMPSP